MNIVFIILALSLTSIVGHTQMPTLPCTKVEITPAVLYKGVPNEIKVSASSLLTETTIVMNVDTGEIKLLNNKKYIIPTSIGTLRLTLKTKSNQQTSTETFYFETVELPKPQILFFTEGGDIISLQNKMSTKVLQKVARMGADFYLRQILAEVQVKSFTIVLIKANGRVEELASTNETLKQHLPNLLSTLKAKDFIIFKDLTILFPETNATKTLDNLCIEIE